MRDCLIVVGMHRSGTSALAGAVHRLGVAVGSNIVEAQDDNVRGYYEHRGILELHEDLLVGCGSVWDDIASRSWSPGVGGPQVQRFQQALKELLVADFGKSSTFVVKDPRLCLLLPLWLPVLADLDLTPRVLFAHRSAAEVAGSLARRNGFSTDKSNLLWANHVVAGETASRACQRSFVSFSDFLQDPVGVLDRAARQLGIEWPQSPYSCEEVLGDFIDPSLRHLQAASGPGAPPVIAALEAALAAAADAPDDGAAFDAISPRLSELGAPNPLVVEHLQQVAHREAATAAWAAKRELSVEISAVSTRLSQGVAGIERALEALHSDRSQLAAELATQSQLVSDKGAESERTLVHLTEVAGALETATGHQDAQLSDLTARLDRLQHKVGAEEMLAGLRSDLEYLASVTRELRDQQDRWQRRIDQLAFWRSKARPDVPAES